jgi:hypothetical protein
MIIVLKISSLLVLPRLYKPTGKQLAEREIALCKGIDTRE